MRFFYNTVLDVDGGTLVLIVVVPYHRDGGSNSIKVV